MIRKRFVKTYVWRILSWTRGEAGKKAGSNGNVNLQENYENKLGG